MAVLNDHISPLRCGLKFKPPLLAIVYKDLKSGKTRRRTIPLRGFTRTNDVKAYGDKLLRNPKHCAIVSRLPRAQLDSLLQRVKDAHKGVTCSTDHTPTPSPTHASLFGMPSLTTPTHARDKLNQDFDAALAELLGPEDEENILDITIPSTPKAFDTVTPSNPMDMPKSSSLTPKSTESPISVNTTKPSNTNPFRDSEVPKLSGFLESSELPSLTSPLDKLPSLGKLPPLGMPGPLSSQGLTTQVPTQLDRGGETPDYSADFNSESERAGSLLSRDRAEDKSLSFAIEELEDDDSLALSGEGANFAGDNLLGSSSGDDLRGLNIVTPPPQPIVNGDEDLNKADDRYLAQRKAEMETLFQANQLKPGDEGYAYDKEVAFEGPRIESGWDSNDDSYSDF